MGINIDGARDLVSATDGSLTIEGQSINSTGIGTFTGGVKVGTAATIYSNGNATFAGIITATGDINATGNLTGAQGHFTDHIYIADTIVHTGDTNTKIRFPAADNITFETGGTEKVRFDSNGRVLIGTATAKGAGSGQYGALNVSGRIGSTTGEAFVSISRGEVATTMSDDDEVGNITFNDLTGYEFARIQVLADAATGTTDTPGRIVFQTTADGASSGTERLRITSGGKMLLGTTNEPSNKNTVTPLFNVSGSGVLGAAQITRHTSVGGGGALLHLAGTRGSDVNSYTILQDADGIGSVAFMAADGNEFTQAAEIKAQVDGTPGDNDMPGRLVFSTTADGASSVTERLRITSAGAWGIAGTNYGTDGQVLTSAGSGAAVAWESVAGGITMADQWRVTADFQGNADPIASNWEQSDNYGLASMGSAMTQSSGVFTFPATGYYLVYFTGNVTTQYTPAQPHSHRNTFGIKATTNNSTYYEVAASSSGIYNYGSSSYPSHGTATTGVIFDVTNTTNCKMSFYFGAGQGSEKCSGGTNANYTFVTFVRLGDT